MFPALFISHGAPALLLANAPVRAYFASVGARFRPRSILIVSAHFSRDVPALAVPRRHDANRGGTLLCKEASTLLARAEVAHDIVTIDAQSRDLVHSAWLPLALMFPALDVPVGLLSLQEGASPAAHHALGRVLSPLRERGVLLVGSGSLTHNHLEVMPAALPEQPTEWARSFVAWMADRIEAGDIEAVLDYHRRAPHAERSHPTDEHLLPLFVALGAGTGGRGRLTHDGFVLGTISLGAFEFA